MTKPKHPPRWIGAEDPDRRGKFVYYRTREDVQASARWHWLCVVARVEPAVLETLADVPPAWHAYLDLTDDELNAALPASDRDPQLDEAALMEWARRWHLTTDWCLAYARSTWREWRRFPGMRRTYWMDRDDLAGKLYRPRPGRQAPRLLKQPVHLVWLARFQVREETYLGIAKMPTWEPLPAEWAWTGKPRVQEIGNISYQGAAVKTVWQACQVLADHLDLPLRPAPAGPPPRTTRRK